MHRLSVRYSYKLISNLVSFSLGFITAGIIPRSLGPAAYGDFNFIVTFFSNLTSLFDTGTSSWFYVRLSQNNENFGLIRYYFFIVLSIVTTIFFFIVVSYSFQLQALLWPGQTSSNIVYAAIYATCAWLLGCVESASDAKGLTVYAERLKIVQKILGAIALVLLFKILPLDLHSVFIYNIVLSSILCATIVYIFLSKTKSTFKYNEIQVKKNSQDMVTYILPLTVGSLVSFAYNYADRLILQHYGGSIQQGFFSLASLLSSFCFIFVGSMVQLLFKELSFYAGKKDQFHLQLLLTKYFPLLFTTAAFFSCFVSFNARSIIGFIGGDKYVDAIPVLSVMTLFPIFQTYGQLCSSFFLATDKVKLYRNIGLVFSILGIPLTYIILVPSFGIGGGSLGLAIKTVVWQIIWVNVMLFFNVRIVGVGYLRYFLHQICILISFFGFAYIAGTVVQFLVIKNYLLLLLASGVVYTALSLLSIELLYRNSFFKFEEITVLRTTFIEVIKKLLLFFTSMTLMLKLQLQHRKPL